MIIIGSALLFAFGMLLLLISAARIAVSLIMICYYLTKIAVCLGIAALAGSWLFAQWCMKRGQPEAEEPCITINIYSDEDDVAPIVELPHWSFRRLN
jgi:hypothetical protein